MVDLLRRPDLLHPAVVHHGDPVGHGERLFLVVGHVDEGDPHLALDPLELDLHRLPELEIERAERLVQQEGAGIVDQRSRQRHPLLLPARELRRPAFREIRQSDHREQRPHPAIDLGRLQLPAPGAEGDVVVHRHVGEERVVLEDGVDVAPVGRDPGDVLAFEQDAAAGRLLEPRDHPERRGLAAPGGPEQGEELTPPDGEVRFVDRHVPAEALHYPIELNHGVARAVTPPSAWRGHPRVWSSSCPGASRMGAVSCGSIWHAARELTTGWRRRKLEPIRDRATPPRR